MLMSKKIVISELNEMIDNAMYEGDIDKTVLYMRIINKMNKSKIYTILCLLVFNCGYVGVIAEEIISYCKNLILSIIRKFK